MYTDHLFLYLQEKPWLLFLIIYALSDYFVNIISSIIVGGLDALRYTRCKSATVKGKILYFCMEGCFRLLSYFRDKVALLWPWAVLFTSFFVYYKSKVIIYNYSDKIAHVLVDFYSFRLLWLRNSDAYIEYVIAFFALGIAFSTFYRYQKQRQEQLWLNRGGFRTVHFVRVILFDFPIAFVVISTIFSWVDFWSALYAALYRSRIYYNIFHPDLMYGLRPVYQALLNFAIFLLIFSLLPLFMLLREKRQSYHKVYYVLFLLGIVSVYIVSQVMLIQLNRRVEEIYSQIITAVIQEQDSLSVPFYQRIETFGVISNLFLREVKLPNWLQIFFIFRIIIFALEVYNAAQDARSFREILLFAIERIK